MKIELSKLIKEVRVVQKLDNLILQSKIGKDKKSLEIIQGVIITLNRIKKLEDSDKIDLKKIGLSKDEIEQLDNLSSSEISRLHRAAFAPL